MSDRTDNDIGTLAELSTYTNQNGGTVYRICVDYYTRPPATILGALFDPVRIVPVSAT